MVGEEVYIEDQLEIGAAPTGDWIRNKIYNKGIENRTTRSR